jgi:hypothetical protein
MRRERIGDHVAQAAKHDNSKAIPPWALSRCGIDLVEQRPIRPIKVLIREFGAKIH